MKGVGWKAWGGRRGVEGVADESKKNRIGERKERERKFLGIVLIIALK